MAGAALAVIGHVVAALRARGAPDHRRAIAKRDRIAAAALEADDEVVTSVLRQRRQLVAARLGRAGIVLDAVESASRCCWNLEGSVRSQGSAGPRVAGLSATS